MIRFIADLHIGDKALIENMRHMTVEEHDSLIVKNWNKVVSGNDTVYILGDISIILEGDNDKYLYVQNILKQLKGYKILVGGNHDGNIYHYMANVINLKGTLGCLEHKGYIFTHIPIHPDEFERWKEYGQVYKGNIHGHIHHHDVLLPYRTCKLDMCYNDRFKVQGGCEKCEHVFIEKDKRHFNVCCEKVNYTPLTLEEILKLHDF